MVVQTIQLLDTSGMFGLEALPSSWSATRHLPLWERSEGGIFIGERGAGSGLSAQLMDPPCSNRGHGIFQIYSFSRLNLHWIPCLFSHSGKFLARTCTVLKPSEAMAIKGGVPGKNLTCSCELLKADTGGKRNTRTWTWPVMWEMTKASKFLRMILSQTIQIPSQRLMMVRSSAHSRSWTLIQPHPIFGRIPFIWISRSSWGFMLTNACGPS